MKTVPAVLFLSLLATAACTVAGGETEEEIVDEGEVVLANPDDEGKSDTVFGKSLRYMVRHEWPWTEGDYSMVTDTEVLFQSKDLVRVRSLLVTVGIPGREALDLSVDAESFNDLGDISTDMAFLLFTPDSNGSSWQPTHCSQNYFERVVVDRSNQEIDVVARGAAGDTRRTFSFSECGIPSDVSHVAIFPFPARGWWNLEGYYQLKVEADCGSTICPAGKFLY